MICPNKNSPEWKKAVEQWGEATAYSMFRLGIEPTQFFEMGGTSPVDAVEKAIESEVLSNPDYYKQKYRSFLSKYNSDFTTQDAIDIFVARATSLGTILEDGKIKTNNGYASLFPETQVDHVTITNVPQTLRKELAALSALTKIPHRFINDPAQNFRGRYINDGEKQLVLINLAYVSKTTPLHEYFHPFVRLLLKDNPTLYDQILTQAKTEDNIRESDEETVVQYLAQKAYERKNNSLLKRFYYWISEFFRNVTGKKINTFSEATTVGDLIELFNSGAVDLTKENTLMMADDFHQMIKDAINKAKEIMAEAGTSIKNISADTTNTDYVKALADKFQGKYSTSDNSSFYTDELGKEVAKRLTGFIGDKEYGEFSTKFKKFKMSREEYAARKFALDMGVDTGDTPIDDFKPLIPYQGQNYSLRVLTDTFAKHFGKARSYGKMVHAYIQYALEENAERKQAALEVAAKYANELEGEEIYNKLNIESYPDLKRIKEVLPKLMKVANIRIDLEGETASQNSRYTDKVIPEVVVISDILTDSAGNKLGTTVDGLIQKWTGQVSLLDWKTGDVTKDMNSSIFMQYGEKLGIVDSKLNRAYLEMAFRAMMLKEHFPDMRFDDIMVVKVSKHGRHVAMPVDLQPFLNLIGTYYRNTNPKVYDTILKKGMLDSANYMGVDKAFANVAQKYEVLQFMPKPDALVFLRSKLASLRAGRTNEELKDEPWLVQEISNVVAAIQEIEKLPGMDLASSSPDLTHGRDFKNLSEIANPRVQVLHKSILEAKNATKQSYNEFETKFNELHKAVLLEQGGPKFKSVIENAFKLSLATSVIVGSLPGLGVSVVAYYIAKKILNKSIKNMYSFLWREDTTPGRGGWHLNTSNVGLTKAQIQFRDFIQDAMAKQYQKVVNQVASANIDNPEKSKLKWEILGLPPTLSPDFMPRAPKSVEEVNEDVGGVAKYFNVINSVKYWFAKNVTNYFQEFEYGETKDPIPFKYLLREDSSIIQSGAHSFSPEVAVKGFMLNLFYKEHHDPLYHYAKGLELMLDSQKDETGAPKFKGLAENLSKQIDMQILQKTKEVKITTRDWKITVSDSMAKTMGIRPGTYSINQDKVLRAGKHLVSYSLLGFKTLSALKNVAMIAIVNTMNTTKGLTNRLLGVPPDEFAPNTKDTMSALLETSKSMFNSFIGKADEDKLSLLAKKFDWLPDNYSYQVKKDQSQLTWLSANPLNYAFMFHNVGETYGNLWHLSTMLKSMKFKDENGNIYSAYDAYEVKDGELVWTKGSRGVIKDSDGREKKLTELDVLEVKNMKRTNEMLFGSYRQEERTAIEHTIFGEYLMQFKRFFVTYSKNLYALSSYKDMTVGKYVESMKKPNGVSVWEWEQEITQARVAVLLKSMLMTSKKHILTLRGMELEAKAQKISTEEYLSGVNKFGGKFNTASRRKHLASLVNTALWLSMLFLMYSYLISDDDDVEEYGEKYAKRIIWDASMGLYPQDVIESMKSPIVGVSRTADVLSAFGNFMYSGVTGKRTREGTIPGSTTVLRSIPGVSGIMQWQDLYKEVPSSAAFEFIGARD